MFIEYYSHDSIKHVLCPMSSSYLRVHLHPFMSDSLRRVQKSVSSSLIVVTTRNLRRHMYYHKWHLETHITLSMSKVKHLHFKTCSIMLYKGHLVRCCVISVTILTISKKLFENINKSVMNHIMQKQKFKMFLSITETCNFVILQFSSVQVKSSSCTILTWWKSELEINWQTFNKTSMETPILIVLCSVDDTFLHFAVFPSKIYHHSCGNHETKNQVSSTKSWTANIEENGH